MKTACLVKEDMDPVDKQNNTREVFLPSVASTLQIFTLGFRLFEFESVRSSVCIQYIDRTHLLMINLKSNTTCGSKMLSITPSLNTSSISAICLARAFKAVGGNFARMNARMRLPTIRMRIPRYHVWGPISGNVEVEMDSTVSSASSLDPEIQPIMMRLIEGSQVVLCYISRA